MTAFNSLLDRASAYIDGAVAPFDVAYSSECLDAYLDAMREGRTDDPNDPANWSSAELLELLDESVETFCEDEARTIRCGDYDLPQLIDGLQFVGKTPQWLFDRYRAGFIDNAQRIINEMYRLNAQLTE